MNLQKRWQDILQKCGPLLDKVNAIWKKFVKAMLSCRKFFERYKKFILAVPVAATALMLAMVNLIKLSPLVDLHIQINGEYIDPIVREIAVLGPLSITGFCLLMMFASKRTATPWLVSVISLILPIIILMINAFPI